MAEITASSLIRRLGALKGLRQPHEQGMQECFDYTYPERGNGLVGSVLTAEAIQTKKNRILDDTAADASTILASGIVSGTTPASSIWFGLDIGDTNAGDFLSELESDDEKLWLDNAARAMFENIHATNFDSTAFECCVDIIPAGHFVMYVTEGPQGGYHFESWPIGQCYIAASRQGGPIDTIYREACMTVEQVVNEYGLDNVSEKVKMQYSSEKFDAEVHILHAIQPRPIYVPGSNIGKNLPFASFHVEIDGAKIIRESGYHEFPCIVPRWLLKSGSAYASGQMTRALGSVRTINDIKALEMANLDVAVGGMWIGVDDGVLNPRSIKIGARKVVVASSTDSLKELKASGDFSVAFTSEERLQATIRKILMADQLQPQGGPAMTATEVHVRVQLIRQLLGPIYGRMQAEYLQPLIRRCFGIAYRSGVLGQAPDSLRQKLFNVTYISPLARAQRLEDVTAMDRMETTLLSESQADNGVLDVYDFEAAARERAELLGVPQKLIRSVDDVTKLRKLKMQAQQAAQAQQAIQGLQYAQAQQTIQQTGTGQ